MKAFRGILLGSAVGAALWAGAIMIAHGQSPLQWNYSFDSNGLAFAQYPGKTGKGGDISIGSQFTVSGGAVSLKGGSTAGQFTTNSTGTNTYVITMGSAPVVSAPNGWQCSATDITPATPVALNQTTPISQTQGSVKGAVTSGDVVVFQCEGY